MKTLPLYFLFRFPSRVSQEYVGIVVEAIADLKSGPDLKPAALSREVQ